MADFLSMTATKPSRWWKQEDKKHVGRAIVDVARELREEQKDRRERLTQYFRLYGNFNSRTLTAGGYNKPRTDKRANRLTFNVIQSSIDTVVAKIAKNRPRPRFQTDGGDWSEQQKAKHLDQLVQGGFYQARVYDSSPLVFRDSCIFGTGVSSIGEDETTGKVAVERQFVDELFVDDLEAVYGKPRSMFQRVVMPREILLGRYGREKTDATKDEKAAAKLLRDIIEKQPCLSGDGVSERASARADLIEVYKGWHLPSFVPPKIDVDRDDEDYAVAAMEGHDGRYTLSLPDSGAVIYEAYRKQYFPFALIHWTDPVRGFWGQGAADQIFGIQYELNKILRIIQMSADLCIPKLYVDRASKVARAHLDDLIGAIVEYTSAGQPPKMEVWNGVSEQLVQQVDRLVRQAYEIIGVSLMSAAGRKPSGLESGAALREYHDIETERFVMAGRGYEAYHMEVARQYIEVVRDIAEREGDYTVSASTRSRSLVQVAWSSVDLDADAFVMQVFPTSSLPDTPAGKLAMVEQMMNQGFLDKEDALRLLDFPDLEAVNELAQASAEFTHWQIEQMVERGLSRQPHPFQNIAYALKNAEAAYLRGTTQKVSEKNLELLRNYIAACTELLKKAAPPPLPALGGPALVPPGAPALGGPPGPPGMMPGAGGPIPMPPPIPPAAG